MSRICADPGSQRLLVQDTIYSSVKMQLLSFGDETTALKVGAWG